MNERFKKQILNYVVSRNELDTVIDEINRLAEKQHYAKGYILSPEDEELLSALHLTKEEIMDLAPLSISSFDKEFLNSMSLDMTVAIDFDRDDVRAFKTKLLELTGFKNIFLSLTKDPDLIGGAIISYNGQMLDYSMRFSLNTVLKSFSSKNTGKKN